MRKYHLSGGNAINRWYKSGPMIRANTILRKEVQMGAEICLFNVLSRAAQDDIIRRTEQTL